MILYNVEYIDQIFLSSFTKNIFLGSVLRNVADSDQGKIQRRVMEWFRHSKARHHNEEKRNAIGHTETNIDNLNEQIIAFQI